MDKFTVRRKILRGSLSAPVVLTVASPASLAAASTTCLVNTPQTPLPEPLFQPAGTDDGYLRKPIQVCQLKSPGGGDGAWTTDFYYQSNGSWYSVSSGSPFAQTVTDTRACETKEVLVYVDAQGNETGYGWPSTANGGSFTSIGCWNSLLIRP
jgi:hypothetical protein